MKRWFVCKVERMGAEVWVEAESHGKARYKCLKAAWEAGYNSLSFKDIRAYLDVSGLPPLPGTIVGGEW